MSEIEECVNCFSDSLFTSNLSWTYALNPSISFQPDAMIILQVAVTAVIPTIATGTFTTFDITSDIANRTIATVSLPYTFSNSSNTSLSFLSNPQTYVKISKPLQQQINFTMTPVSSLVPNTVYVSIQFDLIKYKKK
jgi:hypothetical protein